VPALATLDEDTRSAPAGTTDGPDCDAWPASTHMIKLSQALRLTDPAESSAARGLVLAQELQHCQHAPVLSLARCQTEFGEDAAHVALDGLPADEELLGQCRIGQTLGH
jgi:hypothetical protein